MPLPLAPHRAQVAKVDKKNQKVILAGTKGPREAKDPTGLLHEGDFCAVCQGVAYPFVSYSPNAPEILNLQGDRALESYLHFDV